MFLREMTLMGCYVHEQLSLGGVAPAVGFGELRPHVAAPDAGGRQLAPRRSGAVTAVEQGAGQLQNSLLG